VVGEGANLGATQRGRIEYASKGGRINTDAIDNSAGVATSDHEVNIKILLGAVMAQGDMTLKQRDVLLAEMTDELGLQVLRDNYLQTQAISLAEAEGPAGIERIARLMRHQEKTGRLNRTIEFLPDDEAMAARVAASKGLTRSELAVMLAYAKMGLYEDLLASNLPDDPYLSGDLVKYFPHALRRGHKDAILKHPLRREIVATMVTNSLVNRCGIGFAFEQGERSGRSPGDVARAYLLARDAFGLLGIWAQIEALDNKADAALQLDMLRATMAILDKATTWLLRNLEPAFDIAAALGIYGGGIAELKRCIGSALDFERQAAFAARSRKFVAGGVPAPLASDVAALGDLAAALDLVRIQRQTKADMARVAQVYFALGARLGFDWLRETAARIPARSAWATRAIAATVDDLDAQAGRGGDHARVRSHHQGSRTGVETMSVDLDRLREAVSTPDCPLYLPSPAALEEFSAGLRAALDELAAARKVCEAAEPYEVMRGNKAVAQVLAELEAKPLEEKPQGTLDV
jgi:glutamate dehydrogenase